MSELSIYPPARHFLRDLGLVFPFEEKAKGSLVARLQIGGDLLDGRGVVRIGFLATCCDLVAGQLARSCVAPDWVATADLELHRLRPSGSGWIAIRGEVLREGRSSVVSKLELVSGGSGDPLAVGSVAFSRLPSQQQRQPSVVVRGAAEDRSGSDAPATATPKVPRPEGDLFERIGFAHAEGGGVQLALHDYIRNSLGGLQGGLAAVLLELASEDCAAAELGSNAAVTDLFVRYLNVGRVGPFRARARMLRGGRGESLVEAEVVDLGAGERQVAVGTAVAIDAA